MNFFFRSGAVQLPWPVGPRLPAQARLVPAAARRRGDDVIAAGGAVAGGTVLPGLAGGGAARVRAGIQVCNRSS